MTRIKKRRTGKKRTEDEQRMAAGRRRARSAEKPEVTKEQGPKIEKTAEQKAAYKKSFQPQPAGRRNRAASKQAPFKKATTDFKGKPVKGEAPAAGKTSGKTRSAGARRIAVAKSVAGNAKGKPALKKTPVPKAEIPGEGKPAKGFAPWNKNKAKRKPR